VVEKRSLDSGVLIWNQTTRIAAPGGAEARAVAVDPSGLYVVGYIINSTGSWLWRIEKRDLTSGTILWVETSTGVRGAANSVGVDSSGLYIVGYDRSGIREDYYSSRLEKRNLTDGKLLWFQRVQINSTTATDNPAGVVADGSGVYIAITDKGFRTEKRNPVDGTLIWAQTSQVGFAKDVAIGVSEVYIVGIDAPASNAEDFEWRIEKRNKTDGTLEWVRTENIATAISSFENWDMAEHVAVDSSGIYVVGMDRASGNCEWRIEKRTT
jgi:hypothetical protein